MSGISSVKVGASPMLTTSRSSSLALSASMGPSMGPSVRPSSTQSNSLYAPNSQALQASHASQPSQPSHTSQTRPSHSQVIYTPRLKKVLKSYQASAVTSLNGPDWVSARASSSSSASSLSPSGAAALPLASTPPTYSDAKHSLSANCENAIESAFAKRDSSSSLRSGSHLEESLTTKASAGSIASIVSSKLDAAYDPFLAPPPFPIQQPPIFTPPDQNRCERSETILEGETISCFTVGGEKRLCLPQILTTVLREFSLPQINSVCDEMQIFCSRCSNDQLEVLKVTGIIPASAPSCGLITKTDAERLCSSLLHSNPPKSSFSSANAAKDKRLFLLRVYHECFGKCVGVYVPSLYVQPFSPCIECRECHGLFAPQKFVCHSHRSKENRTCHWGFDSSNWRAYLLLCKVDSADNHDETLQKHLDEMKSRFDYKRKIPFASRDDNRHSETIKRLKSEETSSQGSPASPSQSSVSYAYPSYLLSPYAWASDPAMLMYWYPSCIASGASSNSNATLAARLSAFKPWSPSTLGNGKHLSQNISHVMSQGYNNILPTHKLAELPLLQNSEIIASKRYCEALAPTSPQIATTSVALENAFKSNNKLKSRKAGINYDDDSLSSTTTFSSENSNFSDEESVSTNKSRTAKSRKLFSNLEFILNENKINEELKLKILTEVENIIKNIGKNDEKLSSILMPTLSTKKVFNGMTTEKKTNESFNRNKISLSSGSSPLTVTPHVSCSPTLIKSEPNVSPADPKINCVH